MPKRIQRKRAKGWRMPPNTVYVGRPSRWGNRFHVSPYNDAKACVTLYQEDLERRQRDDPKTFIGLRVRLAGKDLACWCALDQPCHADVLLDLANPERSA